MARGACNFRERDLARAIRGARAGGLNVARVLIDPKTGKITVEAGESTEQDSAAANEWDTPKVGEGTR
jgi:hypothetical protein